MRQNRQDVAGAQAPDATNMRPGQIVLCIRDQWSDATLRYVPNRPVFGGCYTLRAAPHDAPTMNGRYKPGAQGVHLVEIANPIINKSIADGGPILVTEPSFGVDAFIPLDEALKLLDEIIAERRP